MVLSYLFSLAFLDFTTEETKKENLQKLLAMNLDVMEIEGKWLLPGKPFLTLIPPNKMSSAIFLICFNF